MKNKIKYLIAILFLCTICLTGCNFCKKTTMVKDIESLTSAIQNSSKGEIIKLENNISHTGDFEIRSDKKEINLTIDLNGFTFDDEINIRSVDPTTKSKYDYSVNITIKNGTIGRIGDSSCWYGLMMNGADNMTINLENIKIQAYYAGAYTNGNACHTGATINAKKCKFIGDTQNNPQDCLGAMFNSNAKYNLTECELSGTDGLYLKNGELTMKNCKLNATGEFKNAKYNSNGAYTTGSALVIDSAVGYGTTQHTMYVTVTGGELISQNGYAVYETSTSPAGQEKISYANVTIKNAKLSKSNKGVTYSENAVVELKDCTEQSINQ